SCLNISRWATCSGVRGLRTCGLYDRATHFPFQTYPTAVPSRPMNGPMIPCGNFAIILLF
ncbi:MAG: hypothetical protein IKR83_01895, partial [Bacteroidales bacterium]|nr:hypothetical protein [Bacteroidales bacterium]